MTRKSIATLGILVVLLVSIVGTAAGQSGTEVPTAAPTEEPSTETVVYDHPVVQLLAKYFDRVKEWETETEATPEADGEETPDPSATPGTEEDLGEEVEEEMPIGDQIAQYHEEGMGFGVLVKLYAMAEAYEENCAALEPEVDAETGETLACGFTAEELVEEFKGGTGMGQLFEEHGKPSLLGVGHVRKAAKQLETEEVVDPELEGTPEPVLDGTEETLDARGKPVKTLKAPKVKSNNGRGPKK